MKKKWKIYILKTLNRKINILQSKHKGRDKLVKFFLENGADINAKNSAGDRAMEIAINEMNETEKGSITWQSIPFLMTFHTQIGVSVNFIFFPGFKKIIELLRKYRTSWKGEWIYNWLERKKNCWNKFGVSFAACHQYSLDPIPRILGGDAAKAEEFPWMAALGYPSLAHDGVAFECAGSLISDFYILTAAHCAKLDNQPIVARLGIVSKKGFFHWTFYRFFYRFHCQFKILFKFLSPKNNLYA